MKGALGRYAVGVRGMRGVIWSVLSVVAAAAFGLAWQGGVSASDSPAPPFPADPKLWIGPPQSWAALRGQVVLLDVWTFG